MSDELKDKPEAHETKERYLAPTALYHCEKCKLPFRVPQGSRRRYCEKCFTALVTTKKSRNK